ncbi:MAG: DUF7689 domain-containing protein [Candidatus Acidiferrales bacterium]
MSGSWPPPDFPQLTDADHAITSSATRLYNCLAWAAGEKHRRWDPNAYYWPPGIPREVTVEAFIAAYGTLGYQICNSGGLEAGVEKIAIYAAFDGSPTHAALQLENGNWTSKLGDFEDIEHYNLECLDGFLYGRPVVYLSRPRQKSANSTT